MAKRKARRSAEKQENNARGFRWVWPAVIIIFIVLAVLVVYLQKPGLLDFSSKKAKTFEDAVRLVSKIDANHNISFSDYKKGIFYLESHPRYPNPFNFDEMDVVLNEYGSIVAESSDESARLFVDFRKQLVEAEKYYRLSRSSSKGDLHQYGVSCKNYPYYVSSLENTNASIEKIELMLETLKDLKEKYPENYNSLNLSGDWVKLMNDEITDFNAEMKYKIDLWDQFCIGNQTRVNQTKANLPLNSSSVPISTKNSTKQNNSSN
jgi:hypothetical protein